MATVNEAIEELKNRLKAIPGVKGVGATKSSPERVVVYVEEDTPELRAQIPKVMAGFGVDVEVAHDLVAL